MKSQILIALFLLPSLGYALQMKPGLWNTKTEVKLGEIPLVDSKNSECVEKSKTKDVRATIEKELQGKDCKLSTWNLKGKNLEATVNCDNKDLKAKGALRGTVIASNYDLKGTADGTYFKIPTSISFVLAGEWTKECSN